MILIRSGLLGLCLVIVFGMDADAQVGKKKKALANAAGKLVPPAVLDKLDLTAAQKEKAVQLQKDFTTSLADARKRMQEDVKKAKADKDKAGVKAAAASYQIAAGKVREDLEPRFVAILNDEQKKKYEELKKGGAPVGKGGARPTGPDRFQGKIKVFNLDKGTLVLTVGGKNQTFRLSRATKALNAKGEELSDGLQDKALAAGAEVAVVVEKAPGRGGCWGSWKLS